MKRSKAEREARKAKYLPDPIAVILPPKKSTVKLLVAGKPWNEEVK